METQSTSNVQSDAQVFPTSPIVVLVIGMAGVGKSTLMHRLSLYTKANDIKSYFINLDPAVLKVSYDVNIDISDTVNYKEVMTQYGLGPNGGILTSLNLFATRFDQVIEILERRSKELEYIFVDTPGQIEAFTWSAGGQVILELFASTFPTVVLYVADTPRCSKPTTFMSNMLYSCSILYKSNLPMICTFNKIDVVSASFATEWMTDFESYLTALDNDEEDYMGSLNRSLSLVMDEFYRNIHSAAVSALTGEGIDELFSKIRGAGVEFGEIYLPELRRKREQRERDALAIKEADMKKLAQDIASSRGDKVVLDASVPRVI